MRPEFIDPAGRGRRVVPGAASSVPSIRCASRSAASATGFGTDAASRAIASANVSISCPIAAATSLLSRLTWQFRLCRLS